MFHQFRTGATALAVIVLYTSAASAQSLPVPGSAGNAKPVPLGGNWNVRYIDGSTMKLQLLDEHATLSTPYGPLNIPFREIRRIEFGLQLNVKDRATLEGAVSSILGKDAAKREEGKLAVLDFGPRALPFLKRASKIAEPDAAPHLEHLAAGLRANLVNPKAEPVDFDLIVTDDSRLAGRMQAPALRIQTFQFGELKLNVADIATLSQGPDVDEEKLEIVEGKRIYDLLQTHMGKTFGIRTTGAIQGTVWGSGPFTGDSDLATAAVFAGALKVGQTGIVRVKLVPSPAAFQGGTANGVTTNQYQQYPAGAYEIVVK